VRGRREGRERRERRGGREWREWREGKGVERVEGMEGREVGSEYENEIPYFTFKKFICMYCKERWQVKNLSVA
jgi:hypothetical protein